MATAGKRHKGPTGIDVETGFVNPVYMILVALIGVGVALVIPGLQPFVEGEPASAWHWIELGAGTALIVACVAWYVRWK